MRHRSTELVVGGDPSRNRYSAARRKSCGPCIALNGICQQAIRKDSVTLIVTQHIQIPGADAGNSSGLLNVGEEEQFVLHDRTAKNATELMLLQFRLGWVEVTGRVQALVSVELEQGSMEAVGSGLRHRVHHRAGKLSVLSAEAVGEQAKLGDRIGIRNQARAHIPRFVYLGAVHQESIGIFRLTVGGHIPGRTVETGSGTAIVVAAVRIRRRNAGLKGEQIEIGAAVQRHRQNLRRFDRSAGRRAHGLDLQRVGFDRDDLLRSANYHCQIVTQLVVDLQVDISQCRFAKATCACDDLVMSGRQSQKCVRALAVSRAFALLVGRNLCDRDPRARQNGSGTIANIPLNGSGDVGQQVDGAQQNQHRNAQKKVRTTLHTRPPSCSQFVRRYHFCIAQQAK